MKGLGANRSRHLSESCDLSDCSPGPLYPTGTLPRSPYLLSPTMDHYGTMEPHHFASPSPGTLPPECLLPLSSQISNSSTFPRIHYNSHFDQADFSPVSITGIGQSPMNRLPANLLDQFEKQLPAHRDGFSTLQFHRSGASKQRGDSPGRIRYLVNSVQKLFAKSQSLEVSGKGHANGRFSAGPGGSAGDGKHGRRSKSKERPPKAEPPKRRPRSNMSGYWSSDDLDSDIGNYRSPMTMMSLDQSTADGQASKYFMNSYSTIDKHTLKGSKSNNNLKNQACLAISAPGGGAPRAISSGVDTDFLKGGSWSTLTLSQARQMCQRGSATIDRAMLTKSKSCTQDLTCHYLQVPPEDWNSTLGRGSSSGEIPCRRMRSGSYVKAMGDLEDSDDSESSPKPSPKMAARRQSYLKATQHSLSDQELSTNRSLDSLDCFGGPAGSPFLQWDDEDFGRTCSTLGKSSCHSQVSGIPDQAGAQVRELEVSHRYEETCSESVFGESDSQAVEVLDLPLPTSFRSRSHSYLRAIQAGCSQDDDTASLDSDSPPPTATTVLSTCITTCKKAAPPPVPPRTTSKPFVSVTVQSSTESAQDNYLDSQDHKSEANSQSGRSNSSDSLSSGTRAGGAPKGAQVQLPLASCRDARSLRSPPEEPKHGALTVNEPRANPVPRRKLSSIGIQVDCALPAPREETPPLSKFQSIGVQVEDSWHRSSSMASKPETDSDTQEIIAPKPAIKNLVNSACQSTDSPGRHKQADADGDGGGALRQLPGRAATHSGSTSFSESLDPALDPSSLPPPDPWLESGNNSSPGGPPQPSVPACRRDGHWFLKLLQAETARMEGWCQQMEQETKDNQLSEEVLGKIRSAVGSAQLLMSQKFQQFRGLCQQNLNVNANPRATAQDLAGFWDLLQLSIEDISMKFDELYHLKSNDWQPADSADKKEDKKQPPPVPKKPVKARPVTGKEKVGDTSDRQRQEARKRLMAAKRAASGRQNSATESADSIEIYVPEAQTRL
uniref:DLG associated protein 4 n=1 Tax=Paramormyrops kingsleyae TaxID=1676925 RepID=A0A3B3SDT6_9TELE